MSNSTVNNASLTQDDVVKLRSDLSISDYSVVGRHRKFDDVVAGMPITKSFKFGTAAVANPALNIKAVTNLSQLAEDWTPWAGVDLNNGSYFGTGKRSINNENHEYQAFNNTNFVFKSDALSLVTAVGVGEGLLAKLAYGEHVTGQSITFNAPGGTTATAIAALGINETELAALKPNRIMSRGFDGIGVVKSINTGASTLVAEQVTGSAGAQGGSALQIVFTNIPFYRIAANVTDASNTVTFTEALDAEVLAGCVLKPVVWSVSQNKFTYPNILRFPVIESFDGPRTTVTLDAAAGLGVGTMSAANFDGFMIFPRVTSGQICSNFPLGVTKPGVRITSHKSVVRFVSEPAGITTQQAYTKAAHAIARAMKPGRKKWYWPADWLFPVAFDMDLTNFVGSELDKFEGFPYPHQGSCFTANLHAKDWTCDNLTSGNINSKVVMLDSTSQTLATNGTYTNISNGTAFLVSATIANGVLTAYSFADWSLSSYTVGQVFSVIIGGQRFNFQVGAGHDNFPGATWTAGSMGRNKTPRSDIFKLANTLYDNNPHEIGMFQTREKVYIYLDKKLVRIAEWEQIGDDPFTQIFNLAAGPGQDNLYWYDLIPDTKANAEGYFDILSFEVREL